MPPGIRGEALKKIFVHVDGSSRGNPGEASIGVVITDEKGHVLQQVGKCIGRTTNNVAEYKALIEGVRLALQLAPDEAVFLTDSQLLAHQINGIYKVREPHLEHLNRMALDLLSRLPKWRVNFVQREGNNLAHRVAESAYFERSRQERERAQVIQDITALLQDLPLEELRKLLGHVRSLRAQIS